MVVIVIFPAETDLGKPYVFQKGKHLKFYPRGWDNR